MAPFRVSSEAEFSGWFFVMARRRVIDLRRYEDRPPVRLTGEAREMDRPAMDDTAAAGLDNLSAQAAVELISTLPPFQAEVIVLRGIAGFDAGRVARSVGKAPG